MNSWVLITDARRLGGMQAAAKGVSSGVTAVVVGKSELANTAAVSGFDNVLWVKVEENTPAETMASAVAELAKNEQPKLVVCNDGPASRIIGGAISGALDAAVIASVIELSIEDEKIVVSREIANAKAIEDVSVAGSAVCIFVGADVELEQVPAANINEVTVDASFSDEVVGFKETGGAGLANAQRVIGIGMGITSKDDLALTDALAGALNAEIACTLPACDNMHWYTADRVLGSSHNTAAPELYISVGISGSPNHTSGIRDAKVVVSINSDPEAEMFRSSKYGIVGDLYKVVPALTAALCS